MEELRFKCDEDFGTEKHQYHRDYGWIGGLDAVYLLSCLERTSYLQARPNVWHPVVHKLILEHCHGAVWISRSSYFETFAVILLKDIYRQTELGRRYPIRAESREERATRFALNNPELSDVEIADRLKTTVKQLQRNSLFKVARTQFEWLKNLNSKP